MSRKRLLRYVLLLSTPIALIALYLFIASGFDKNSLLLLDNAMFFDRSGALLRFIPDEKGERRLWLRGSEIPVIVKNAFITAEDQRFYSHNGFDLTAIARAVKDNLVAGRITSGASTITQQTVRLLHPRKKTYHAKLIEILKAGRMELTLSKDEILEQYLNRAPMGNNIVGIELASRTYFGKPAKDLDVQEAALLASIPKSPGRLHPYGKDITRLLARKDRILTQMAEAGYLTETQAAHAKSEQLSFQRPSFPNDAPHLVDLLVKRTPAVRGKVDTTIDMAVQTEAERIVSSHYARLSYRGAHQAGVMVIHNPTMQALASVGSISFDEKNKGFNNGTIAPRSAGSTLKPFIYGMALDDGLSATRLLEDTLRKYKTQKGDYAPLNFDRREYGPVTMRTALGNSLNISAIKMLEAVGQERFYELLKELDLVNDTAGTEADYGLGLVIGNPEVTIERLVSAYAALANKGVLRPLKYTLAPSTTRDHGSDEARVFSEEAAFIISDILSDPSARFITFGNAEAMRYPFRVSIKTGTSTKYRDGWAIGYTPEYTVGVWTGNFEGNPTFNLSGAEGAGPILNDVMKLLYRNKSPSIPDRPAGVVSAKVCGISGMKPGRFCPHLTDEFFIKGGEPTKTCSFHDDADSLHKLPAAYASWVFDKKKTGTAGNYGLKGMPTAALDAPQDEARIGKNGRYSIGNADEKKHVGRAADADYAVRITYPLPNDGFILEKRGAEQKIKLEAISDKPVKHVEWFIDGQSYKKAAPPYHVYWKPERGPHTISISTPDDVGDSIKIKVE
ncbi:MAG: penicillin-binding protein 1C [Deltaproteobacteria bacterium]|nr:penicillin-binding protein 1C [Deltaproteobacteria bacterium]